MTTDALSASHGRRSIFLQGATMLGLAALITLAAKVQVPFWPVPMTLHTLAVMMIALIGGPRVAVGAMATYLAAGAAGLPVFSGSPERGIGLAYMVGPTGGYLLGFLPAAWIAGQAAGLAQGVTQGGVARTQLRRAAAGRASRRTPR